MVRDLAFRWRGRPAFSIAVPHFEIARGERVFLAGPSGSGKSTLLNLLCGLAVPDAGTVEALGRPFSALSGPRRDRMRAEHFGVIFQTSNLLPYATPVDNVVLPLGFAPARRARVGRDPRGAARRLMAALGLPEAVLEAGSSSALSVGQQQRVAVARALIGRPEIIVADEPTSALDAAAQDAFLAMLFEQVASAGATLLLVSHDERLAARFDRRVDIADTARISRGDPAPADLAMPAAGTA